MSQRQILGRQRHNQLADFLLKHGGVVAFSASAMMVLIFLSVVSMPRFEAWLLVVIGGGIVGPVLATYRRQHDLKHRISTAVSLRSANFTGLQLASQYMRSRDLQKAKFTRANLSRADFTDADLYDARFVAARMTNAFLGGANCVKTSFYRSQLIRANLDGIRTGEGTSFECADLRDAKLRDANLKDARFEGADLRGADLTDSALRPGSLDSAITDTSTTLPDGRPAEVQNLEQLDLQSSLQRVTQLQGSNLVRSASFGLGVALALAASISAVEPPGRSGIFDEVALQPPTRTPAADAAAVERAERATEALTASDRAATAAAIDASVEPDDTQPSQTGSAAAEIAVGAELNEGQLSAVDSSVQEVDSEFVDSGDSPADTSEPASDASPTAPSPSSVEAEPEFEPDSESEANAPPTTDLSEAPLTEADGSPGQPAFIETPGGSANQPASQTDNQTADQPADQAVGVELSLTMESVGGTSSASYGSTLAQGTLSISPQSPQVIGLTAEGLIRINMTPDTEAASATCAISISDGEQVTQTGPPGESVVCELDLSSQP